MEKTFDKKNAVAASLMAAALAASAVPAISPAMAFADDDPAQTQSQEREAATAANALKLLQGDFTLPTSVEADEFWSTGEASILKQAQELAGTDDVLTKENGAKLVEYTKDKIEAANDSAVQTIVSSLTQQAGGGQDIQVASILNTITSGLNLSTDDAKALNDKVKELIGNADTIPASTLNSNLNTIEQAVKKALSDRLDAQTNKANGDMVYLTTGEHIAIATLGSTVRTYSGSDLLQMGTYADLDITFSTMASTPCYVKWTVPDALFAEGVTIVNYGMLAPEVTIDAEGVYVPKVIISEDGRTVEFQLPASDGSKYISGNVDLGLHTDKLKATDGSDMADVIKALSQDQEWVNLPAPAIIEGTVPAADGEEALIGFRNANKTFTITYDTNGGLELASDTIENADLVKVAAKKFLIPVKEGFEFAGWYMDEKLETPLDLFTLDELKDITVYAKWSGEEEPAPAPEPEAPKQTPTVTPAATPVQTQAISKTADGTAAVVGLGVLGAIAAGFAVARRRFNR